MVFEPTFVGERQHLVVYPCRVADAQHVDTSVHQFLGNPVHGHVALRTYQHLRFPVQCLVDGLDKRCCLAGSGRTVYDGYILGAENLVYGAFLGRVQPREADGIELPHLRLDISQQLLLEFGQPVPLAAYHLLQGFEHGVVAGLVEVALYAQMVCPLYIQYRTCVGHDYNHSPVVGIAYGGNEVVVRKGAVGVLPEEAERAAILKFVLNVDVLRAGDFQYQLVQRVVVGAFCLDGIPAQTPLHLAAYAHCFRLPFELLLFVLILHAQQQLQTLQMEGRAKGLFLFHTLNVWGHVYGLPDYTRLAVLFQIGIGTAEVVVAEESVVGRQGRGVGRCEHQVTAAVDESTFALCVGSP